MERGWWLLFGFLNCAVYMLTVAALSNPLGLLLPRKFNACRFPFRMYEFEQNGDLYLKFGIRKWKDRVPDMSRINRRMAPKSLKARPGSEGAWMLLQEACRAEIVHWALMPLSLPCIWLWDWGILITVLFSLGNLPFIMIQRYNRPRQLSLYSALLLKESKNQIENR